MTSKTVLRFAVPAVVALLGISPAVSAARSAGKANQEPASAASDRDEAAVRAMAEAMVRTETELGELLAAAPASTTAAIRHAIAASRESREQALAALKGQEISADVSTSAEGSAAAEARTGDGSVGARASGAARARVAIEAGKERSERALKEALGAADGSSRATIRAAIDVVRDGAGAARAALDGLRPERPERVAADVAAGAKLGIEVERPPR